MIRYSQGVFVAKNPSVFSVNCVVFVNVRYSNLVFFCVSRSPIFQSLKGFLLVRFTPQQKFKRFRDRKFLSCRIQDVFLSLHPNPQLQSQLLIGVLIMVYYNPHMDVSKNRGTVPQNGW